MERTHFLLMTAAIAVLMAGIAIFTSCNKDDEKNGDAMGTIYGTVTDIAGDPVSNVNVKLKPSGEATLTGSDGTYEFKNIKAGKYTLQLSKDGYADLDDDYIIELEAGRSAKRDVSIQKQMASLLLTDMAGNEIHSLDFGIDKSLTTKSFNIYNNSSTIIDVQFIYSCAWINNIVAASTTIAAGQTRTVIVSIDREKVPAGENRTFLHVISLNGSNELQIIAVGQGGPSVTTYNVSNITSNSATCGGDVTSSGNGSIIDRGLCWATTKDPTILSEKHLSIGTGTGSFSGKMTDLSPSTIYYVRAYATNELGTSYGEQKQFVLLTEYEMLPTFEWNGHTYKVLTNQGEVPLSQNGAKQYCEDLTYYGYSDWFLPTIDQLQFMYQQCSKKTITFNHKYWSSSSYRYSCVNGSYIDDCYDYYYIDSDGRKQDESYQSYEHYFFPIRLDH